MRGLTEADIALIGDDGASLQNRVLAVLRQGHWFVQASALEKQQYLQSQAGAISVMAGIIRKDWPAEAKFSMSTTDSDRLVLLTPDMDPAVLAWGPLSGQRQAWLRHKASYLLRSLRRAAADALAEMMADPKNAVAVTPHLVAAGFFDDQLLPRMLSDTMSRAWPGIHLEDASGCPDQSQALAFRLLQICACAAQCNQQVARVLLLHGIKGMFMAYVDPWMLNYDPGIVVVWREMCAQEGAAQAEPLRAERKALQNKTWELQHTWTPEEVFSAMYQADTGRMTYLMAQLAIAVLRRQVIISDDGLLLMDLLLTAQIDCKISSLLDDGGLSEMMHQQLWGVSDMFNRLWSGRCYRESKRIMEQRNGPEGLVARANALRLSGTTAFNEGRLQSALKDYRAALQLSPTEAVLYSNVALVQLKLDNINEAYNAALCALEHDATFIKAWVRLGDAFRGMQRWQLAQLCYAAANRLQQDPAVEERHKAALERVSTAWTWSSIPAPWEIVAAGAWLGCREYAQHDAGSLMKERVTRNSKHAHRSRYIAVQLKQVYLMAEAWIRIRAGDMQAVPCQHNWNIGWSDLPYIGRCSGTLKHMITIADSTLSNADRIALAPTYVLEGRPSPADFLQTLAVTCLYTTSIGASKPKLLKMPYRMLYAYAELKDELQLWGVQSVLIETKAESQRNGLQCDTDWQGIKYAGMYEPEVPFDLQGCRLPDTGNDQRPASSSSSNSRPSRSSTGAAVSNNSSSSRRQEQQRPAAAAAAAAAAATGGGGSGGGAAGTSPQADGIRGSTITERCIVDLGSGAKGGSTLPPPPPAAATAGAASSSRSQRAQAGPINSVSEAVRITDRVAQEGAFVVGGSKERVVPRPDQVSFLDTWDGFTISRPQQPGGPEVETVHVKLEGSCRQGRLNGTGDWLPGALEWIRVLERTRSGSSSGVERAWVQQETRHLKQLNARRMQMLQVEQQQRRQQRHQQ